MGGLFTRTHERRPQDSCSGLQQPNTTVQDTVDIVVTTQNVSRGQELSEGLVQVVAIPREDYTEGVFFNSRLKRWLARGPNMTWKPIRH